MSSSSSINIRLKKERKVNKRVLNTDKYTPREIFKKYLSIEEIKKHPEIPQAIRGDKKFHLDILSQQKPSTINIEGIQSLNKIKFANRLNAFHKLFFDHFKNNRSTKNEINLLRQENYDFSKKYKISNQNNIKEKFSDIINTYKKRNYYLPEIEKKNLFSENILLSNNEELKNYILYNSGTRMGTSKSLSFLHKINAKMGDKTSEKELKIVNSNLDMIYLGKDRVLTEQKNEIKKTQNDIINITETIKSIDDINRFFTLNNN